MKKYVFLILISCILILTAILAGLSLGPTSSYLENKAGLFQGVVDSSMAVLPQRSGDPRDELSVEYVSDQAIMVQLPDAHLQEQLELALGASSFGSEDRGFEDGPKRTCTCPSAALELNSSVQSPAEATQGGEETVQSQTRNPYAIYIWHPVETPPDYTLVVGQEDVQPDPNLACGAPAEES